MSNVDYFYRREFAVSILAAMNGLRGYHHFSFLISH